MKKYLLSAAVLFLSFQLCFTQQEPNEALKTTFQDGEFFLARGDYLDALIEFQQVYKRGYDNANVNYRIGVCYVNIPGQKNMAIPHLEKAIKNITTNYTEGSLRETKAPIDAFLFLGNAYRIDNQIDKAISSYNEFKKRLIDGDVDDLTDEENIYLNYANQQIKACKIAKDAMAEPVAVDRINLGEEINSSSSNYRAVMSGDGQSMVYMFELPFYEAVYYSVKENGQWTDPKNLTPEIRSDGDQYVSHLSYDGTQLLLSREDVFDSEIYISNLQEDGRWSPSEPLGNNINTKFWESHASTSRGGDTLYFASNRRESTGGMDIFYSVKDDDDWGDPKNLGVIVNTKLNEEYPFLTSDGQKLFFCSQGHSSIGGYDIFYSVRDQQGNWQEPVNMGYPFNTTDDDLFYFPIDNEGDCGLLAYIDEDGYGKEDIYKICKIPQQRVEEAIAEQVEIDREEEIEVQESIDSLHHALEETDEQKEPTPEPQKEKPEEFTVKPVYFAFNKADLSREAKDELDRITHLMKRNEEIQLSIYGYTDAMGPEQYNLVLANSRAEAAKAYLLKQGIDNDRIKTYAKGELDPVEPNENPDGTDNIIGRKKNRRVQFEFSATDKANVKIIR
ncbi:MAG: OmpA family protein [Bacteroidetes bacterium]|jgi:outer membrane protein OmpA-like peptidoglycan-associated protein|nr:OmpA family protein [Bacteroidota bacterium]